MNSAERQQRKLYELAQKTAGTAEGYVVSQDWDNRLVTVNVGGSEQTLKWEGDAPWPGGTVRVHSLGLNPYCTAVWGAPLGTVQSVGSGYATVLGDDSLSYTYVDTVGVSAGNRVRLDHAGRCVVAVLSVEPADSEVESVAPVAAPSATRFARWFDPQWSGNFRPGFAGPAVEISTSRMGMYGFGSQIADTIPDSASLAVMQLHLVQNWDYVPGVASSMGTHSFNGMPGSASNANLSGTTAVPGGNQVVNLLGSVGDALKTGAAFGVGFRSGSSGWRQYAAAPGSGRIYAEWVV